MYDTLFTEKFEKQLKKLPKVQQGRVIAALERSRIRPEHHFERLVGEKSYKLRMGDFRLIADIDKGKLIILCLKAGHRKNIYQL